MKVTSSKSENKKRKRDDPQEGTSDSSKKAKVHAQRKFAQGAAFNSSVITLIKNKVRPAASTPAPGPMLTSKCPNTEDFLTFLCFRRTSILPSKLDFFKDGLSSRPETPVKPEKATTANRKSNIEHSEKQTNKKQEKRNEKKKAETHAVQALRKKYKEQRLAKQKVTNVAKLAQKVKGKNMVRTRSSTVVTKTKSTPSKKPALTKDTGALGLRSGLKRIQVVAQKPGKIVEKPKHLRGGLRSGKTLEKVSKTSQPVKPTIVKKQEKEVKKKAEVPDKKPIVEKVKKGEGFSDFSSDDNEPLLAAKKPIVPVRKLVKSAPLVVGRGKKAFIKTRARVHVMESTKAVIRPTRKTKEAAAIYMEMITKKLVSPEKSGDDDVSSVDSFPELPNAKRNEQRETEIKAKAQALKKVESKLENKTNESQKTPAKKDEQSQKVDIKVPKDETSKKISPKKEVKGAVAKTETPAKKSSRRLLKEEPSNEVNTDEMKDDSSKKLKEDGSKKVKEDVKIKDDTSKKVKEDVKIKDDTSKKVKEDVKIKDDTSKKVKEETGTKKEIQSPRPTTRSSGLEIVEPLKKLTKVSKEIKTGSKEAEHKEKGLVGGKKGKEEAPGASKKVMKKETEKAEAKGKEVEAKKGKKEAGAKSSEKKVEKTVENKKVEKEKPSEVKKVEKEKPSEVKKIEKEKSSEVKKVEKIEKEKLGESKKVEKDKGSESKKVEKEKVSEIKRVEKEKVVESKKNEKEKVTEIKKAEKLIENKKVEKEKVTESKKVEKEKAYENKKIEKEKVNESKKVEKEKLNENKKVEKEKLNDVKKVEKEKTNEIKKVEKERPNENKKVEKEKVSESKKVEKEKASESKKVEKEKPGENKERKRPRKTEKKEMEPVSILSKRPTRKCSTADKIWIDIDGFTSDEDDFLDLSPVLDTKVTPDKSFTPAQKERVPEKSSPKEKKKKEEKESKEELKVSKTEKGKQESVSKGKEPSVGKSEESKDTKTKAKNEEVNSNQRKNVEEHKVEAKGSVKDEKASEVIGKEVETSKPSEVKSETKKSPGRKPKKKEKTDDKPEADTPKSDDGKRKRPVRQCSTGEKRWIETDSDSFSYYESSEDDLPIFEISNRKRRTTSPKSSSPKVAKKDTKSSPEETSKKEDKSFENFSDSDEEPLKKKAHVEDAIMQIVGEPLEDSPKPCLGDPKGVREMPALHPLKKPSVDVPLKRPEGDRFGFQTEPMKIPSQPVVVQRFDVGVPAMQPLQPIVQGMNRMHGMHAMQPQMHSIQPQMHTLQGPGMQLGSNITTVPPSRVEMVLHSLPKDRLPGENDVKVTFESSPPVPAPLPNPIPPSQIPCTYQIKPMNFPPPREPISTHGLDLLSEVALPTTPHLKLHSQTERIEKWLNDSIAAEHKKRYPVYDTQEPKDGPSNRPSQPEPQYFYGKPVPAPAKETVSSHPEFVKYGQMELLESQRLLKKNVFSAEPKQEVREQAAPTPKKALTSVQELLKLQKERKDVAKTSVDNSPHLKNCKCNNCIVKKGWFKNKPLPKTEQPKSPVVDDREEAAKPFESLTKAFKVTGEGTSSKMSVSVAPMVASKQEGSDKKIVQQKKLSFLERMKERERKEAAAKLSAFSPNNESSVYAFEPEPEQTPGVSAPFRSRTRESRTSRSDEEGTNEPTGVSSGTQVDKADETKPPAKAAQSTSIAVQVNLDTETTEEPEPIVEVQDSKSIEISTQTEVPEEDADCPMFYIPLQQGGTSGAAASSDQQMIQGVALKLDTEGPMGPNQRVIMKAKLVTKPPDVPSIKAVVMPQPKRMFDQKNNNPPIGTVQPTTRKPPEVVSEEATKSTGTSAKPCEPEPETPSPKPKPPKVTGKGKDKGKEKEKEKVEASDDQVASSSKPKKGPKGKEGVINPSNSTWLPPAGTPPKLVEAPTFHPTEKEFQDPFEFFDRIRPAAEKFGLCRIVPPSTFKPDCKVSDDMRFTAYNQYVHRMYHRWGPNVKEMMAIKKYLTTQSISLKQPPWIGGIEVDLPRLYQSVQSCGGLMKVMEKKKWNQVADMMRIPKAAQDRVTKLDDIYCKYLLPYDTLSPDERQKLFDEVEKDWSERQRTSAESQTDDEEENYIEECEECVVKGRNMGLNQFYRIARNTMSMWFKNPEPPPREVENEFWKHVKERNHHVCVHSGSIDSSGWGYGFPVAKNNSFSKHPWNLKVLTNNNGSVLRSLGPVMGVTVPTLHVGMVFTAFCWYRDPHGLPWIEYLHTGAPKIWYGISDDNSTVFQEVLTKLLPRYIKNKTIWLPSDTAMIPPDLLVEHGVSLCHTVQEPGQFILVFPRAFTSSICTGYLVSESVYFAQPSWLTTAQQVFKDIQESSEPSMFSLEKLLFSIATDSRSSVGVLKQVLPMVWHVREREMDRRKTLHNLGLKSSERLPPKEFEGKKRKGRWNQGEDGEYECEVCRMNLHVSLVTNSHEEGVYCLPHAIDLLTEKRHHSKYCKLMYTYSEEEMDELVEKLEQRIESKSQKKSLGKSSSNSK